MTYTGQCACGAVRAAIVGAPVQTRQCWCRQCQQIAGGSPTNNAIFATQDVAIEGALGSHAYVAASGNTLTHSFCPQCGTAVMAQSSARPQFRTIRLGFLTPPHDLRPQMAIWTEEAPAWAVIDPAMAHFPAQPPAPNPEPEQR